MDMMGVIGLGSRRVKEDKCTLSKRVAEKDTRGGLRSKFMQRIQSKPWIPQTTKDMKFRVIGRSPE